MTIEDIPWDKARMEFAPVSMTVMHENGMRFTARAQTGLIIPIDAHRHLGGGGEIPNPIDYLFASLGGCVGIKILLSLSDDGIVPDHLEIAIEGTRRQTLPATFDHVHFIVTITAPVPGERLTRILDQTMTRLCPVAAIFVQTGKVTFEHRISR